jgi:hypothetical protein
MTLNIILNENQEDLSLPLKELIHHHLIMEISDILKQVGVKVSLGIFEFYAIYGHL